MNKRFMLSAAAVLFGAVIVGCQNTAEGVKADADKDTTTVTQGVDKAVDKTVVGTQKAVATTEKAAANAAAGTEKAMADTAAATQKAAANAAATTEKAAANAAAGTEKAVANTAAATQKAAANAADATSKAAGEAAMGAKHIGKVMTITPKVKAALLRDDTLYPSNNAAMNSIDVDTTSDGQTIRLSGTVKTNDMKKKATQVAEETLKGESTKYKIDNELKVSP